MSARLRTYLVASAVNRRGWLADYESTISPDKNYPYLCGWYESMLDELVELLGGPDKVIALVDARDACVRKDNG
jgi:hypothetical protein